MTERAGGAGWCNHSGENSPCEIRSLVVFCVCVISKLYVYLSFQTSDVGEEFPVGGFITLQQACFLIQSMGSKSPPICSRLSSIVPPEPLST